MPLTESFHIKSASALAVAKAVHHRQTVRRMLSKVILLLAAVVVFATAQSPPPTELPPTDANSTTLTPLTDPLSVSPPTSAPDEEQEKKEPPPHTLVKPKTWKLGTTERLSLTIYDFNRGSRSIEAILYVRRCTCVQVPQYQRRCMDDAVFSSARVQAKQGEAALLNIKLPDHDDVPDGQFYLTVQSTLGEKFMDKQLISFSSNSRGMIVVKTDKPIYKPSQTFKFCVITLDAVARPRPAEVSVKIQDPRSRKIEEWKSVEIPADGYKCLELELADEPPLGTWKITVNEIVERGSCSNYYGSLSGSCDFKVDTFVLPRFEVKVDAPEYIHKNLNNIKGTVSAEYVFGEPVEGTVNIKFTLEAKDRGETFDFHTITDKLKKGKVDFKVPAEDYMRILRYRFDPFCVSSSIKIFAEVEEKGRGTKFNYTANVPLVANRVRFVFDEKMPRMFRAGMDYPVMIKSLLPDGKPASSKKFKLTVTANNGDIPIYTKTKSLSTDKKGEWMKTYEIPSEANCLKILVNPVEEEYSCENTNICLTPVAVFSPSSTYLQLTSSNMEPKIGDTLTITATSNRNFELLQCMVTARGQLLSHQTVTSSGNSADMKVVVSARHTPRFQVVCYTAQEDGELVGDVLEMDAECSLEHKVAMTFHRTSDLAIVDEENSVVPMTEVYVNVTSSPNTPVLVSVFDKSLSLLAGSCDLGKKSSVCKKLDSIASGTITSVDHSCTADTQTQCCPSQCQEPQKVDISVIINSLGINVMTNMYLPRAPSITTYSPISGVPGPSFSIDDEVALKVDTVDVRETDEADSEVRKFFPEGWLFEVIETGSNGRGKLPATVPDTITTWVGESVALSKKEGIGFSDMASLTVFKEFFVSLELPYSVNFGETVVIKPVVFNFLPESILVTIVIDLHDDLSLLNRDPGPLPIEAGSSNHFEMRILSRAIGQLPIRITAQVFAMNLKDAVEKPLNVKPGCVRYEKTSTLIATDDGEASFEFELPTCTIPGSQKASITVTGDLMSPPNLDNLLVVPSGCGEQNLVKTTNNFVVADYLDSTGQLTDAIAARVRSNIMNGYQRELNYQLFSGAFAIWPSGSPSVWLTAFALGSFSEMSRFYGDASFIDEGVLSAAFTYLLGKQKDENGCFELEGAVHNYRLLNDDAPITAYVLNALIDYEMLASGNAGLERSIDQATGCLANYTETNSDDICTYTLALSTYALVQTQEKSKNSAVITQLKGEIRSSVDYPGTCYVCNSCTVTDSGQMGQMCEGESPRTDPITSDCVETTAYTLLALLEAGETEMTACLAQWLIKQQNSYGSFGSSQDTIVGLKALAAFSRRTFTREMNMLFEVETDSQNASIMIDNENRYIRHEVVVNDVPGSAAMYWIGQGTALVQSVLSYHGCDCCNSSDCFQLGITPLAAPEGSLAMEVCFSYQCGKKSNMAILDVQIPSGCTPVHPSVVTRGDVVIRRVDLPGDNAVFYLDEVTGVTSCIKAECEIKYEIENRKPLAVTIYDYYMPTERVTAFVSFE